MNETITEALTSFDQDIDINSIELTPLLGGISKANLFCFIVKNKKYVLRLFDKKKRLERRISEFRAHKIATELNIAPKIVFVDSECDPFAVIMEFIDGRTLTIEDLNNKTVLEKIIKTIKKFHDYNCSGIINKTKIDAINSFYERESQKEAVYPNNFNDIRLKLILESKKFKRELSPTHGDLNPQNILIDSKENIYLIDWGGARIDNPFIDIGGFACFCAANNSQLRDMLEIYLSRIPKNEEFEEALFFKNVMNFFIATLRIGRQTEKNRTRLDEILNDKKLKRSSEYIKENFEHWNISDTIELTKYALSWFKEFMETKCEIDAFKMNEKNDKYCI